MDAQISFADVQAALQRCLKEHPPIEQRLCRDASLLADVFGEMTFGREQARAFAALSDDQRAAFERWHVPR
jgi:hypothetical protein